MKHLGNLPKPGLDKMLCFDIYAANQAFGQLYKPLLAPLGLTYLQYLVLVTLWTEAPLRVGQIGARLGLESNTLTPLLKRMAEAGLITRTRDPRDERRVEIALTDAGRALEARARDVPACVVRTLGMPLEDLVKLQADLRRLTAAMTQAAPT